MGVRKATTELGHMIEALTVRGVWFHETLLLQQRTKGEFLVYISTHENRGQPRKSWSAVYLTFIKTRETRRLTPYGVADFSPSVSPFGTWTGVASSPKKLLDAYELAFTKKCHEKGANS